MNSSQNLLAIIPAHHKGSCKYENPPAPGYIRATQLLAITIHINEKSRNVKPKTTHIKQYQKIRTHMAI